MAKKVSKNSKSRVSGRLKVDSDADIRRNDRSSGRTQEENSDNQNSSEMRENKDSKDGKASNKRDIKRAKGKTVAIQQEGDAERHENGKSKTHGNSDSSREDDKDAQGASHAGVLQGLKGAIQRNRKGRINPHKSFKRSYREDYVRETAVPGIMYHIFASFKTLFKNWKIFLPLVVLTVALNVLFVGVMDEASYVQFQDILDYTSAEVAGGDIGNVAKAGLILISTITTGGLSGESSEAATVFGVLIFLIIWLTTIFLLRHLLAGHNVKLRDGLYNAMTPLISTFLVFVVAVIQCIPIFILIIAYSAAVQTDFLATPFYALVFFIFAALMLILSGYLLSSSLIAMLAVSVPGMYPMRALRTASDLMMGRRIKFILRIIALLLMLAILWVLVMLPLILFDMWMKSYQWTAGIPFVPICMTAMTCFTATYVTTYLYLYYRWMLDV